MRVIADAPGRGVAAVPLMLRDHQYGQESHQQMCEHRPAGTEDTRENRDDECGDQLHLHPPDVREVGRVDPATVALCCP